MPIGMISLGFSLLALMFLSQLLQRERSVEQADQTLGTPSAMVFAKIILPTFKPAVFFTLVTMFVYCLGVYVMPKMLGRPKNWNMSVIMLVFTLQLIGGVALVSRKEVKA